MTTVPTRPSPNLPSSIWARSLAPVTIALLLNVSLAAFDTLAVNAALPDIGADLGEVGLLSWVITAFLLTSAVALLLAGPLIDSLGARTVFRFSSVAFVLSSAACALAPTMHVLVAARAVQGFGGGLAVAVSFASVGIAYPGHLTARAFAAESMVWGTVGFGGPPIVAALVAIGGWHAAFLINIPVGAIAITTGWSRIPAAVHKMPLRLDARGIVLLTAFTFAALLGLSTIGRWTLPWFVIAGVAVLGYRWHLRRSREPVLVPRQVFGMPFGALNIVTGLSLGAAIGTEAYLPVYLRGGEGLSNSMAAFSVASMSVGWTAGSVVASHLLDRLASTVLLRWGMGFLLPGLLAASISLALDTGVWTLLTCYVALGLGVGLTSTAAFTKLQHSSPSGEIGRITAGHQYIRTLGSSVGVAIAGSILLLEVGRRTGGVAVLQSLLAGDNAALDAKAVDAIRSGYAWAHLAAAAMTAIALVPLVLLSRRTGDRQPN
jgi:MFS family permease